MSVESEPRSFDIIGGAPLYDPEKEKEPQNKVSFFKKLQNRYGGLFFTPKYITFVVLFTIVDLLIIMADLMLRLYSDTFKSLLTVEKVFSIIIIVLRSIYLAFLIIKLILNIKKLFKNVLYILDAIIVVAAFVLVIIYSGLNRIAFSLVITLRLVLTIQMLRNNNKKLKQKQEDEINEYSRCMDEQLEREKAVRKHIQDQIDNRKGKIQLLTGGY